METDTEMEKVRDLLAMTGPVLRASEEAARVAFPSSDFVLIAGPRIVVEFLTVCQSSEPCDLIVAAAPRTMILFRAGLLSMPEGVRADLAEPIGAGECAVLLITDARVTVMRMPREELLRFEHVELPAGSLRRRPLLAPSAAGGPAN